MEKKKITIFGATGGTGLQLVELALEKGFEVTAFVRNPEKIGIIHSNLNIFQGDVLDPKSVSDAIKGQDAVLSALGAPPRNKQKIRSEGTKNIIKAMQENGVKRFICMTTIGVGDSKPLLPFHFKYILVPFFLKGAFADTEVQERYIFESDLDWTIVRPGALTDKEKTGTYKHGFPNTEKIKAKVSRADVAEFMLKQLEDEKYLRKVTGISY